MAANNIPGNFRYAVMKQLELHKAYKVCGIVPTDHEHYGPGYLAYPLGRNGVKLKMQLPSRLVREEDHFIVILMNDIMDGQLPYLIFRGMAVDATARLNIIRSSEHSLMQNFDTVQKHLTWGDVEEIPESSYDSE